MMVNQTGKGLYKKGYLGREVHEFEIQAALEAQRVFAEMTNTDKIRITCMEYTTPPEGSTYRSITEPIHRKIKVAPSIMESTWVNVWHSVAEASFLITAGTSKVVSFLQEYGKIGLAASWITVIFFSGTPNILMLSCLVASETAIIWSVLRQAWSIWP